MTGLPVFFYAVAAVH